ncbi:MAG TPA: hypothetical protein PKC18_17765 [Lacipirellulaceae bacterium]|nr:hypothetical protein [Lacipirellulaceae bacterium]
MRLDPDQLEWIVREVVRRLRDGAAGATPVADSATAEIALPHPLITLETLESQLAGVARVRVSSRAVVTPAVRDLLRQRGIELVRTGG